LESRKGRHTLRWARIAAILALIAAGMMLAVPDLRATVLSILRIGAIEIVPVEVTPPATTETSTGDLGEPGTLADAEAHFDVPLLFPADLPDGYSDEPDQIMLLETPDPVALFQWDSPGRAGEIGISLFVFEANTRGVKLYPELAQSARVDGTRAYWLTEPHPLQVFAARGEMLIDVWVTKPTLIWQVNSLTYRLESDLELDGAIAIAESFEPMSAGDGNG
jgi:hypothetical protein